MSLIARSEAIPHVEDSDFAKKFDKFKIAQEIFENIENPTDKQKDEYNKVAAEFTKILEKKELEEEYKQSVMFNIAEFERIKEDPRYEELLNSQFQKICHVF